MEKVIRTALHTRVLLLMKEVDVHGCDIASLQDKYINLMKEVGELEESSARNLLFQGLDIIAGKLSRKETRRMELAARSTRKT